MNFAIAIHGDAATSESPQLALRFAQAAIAKGHTIHRVFFYHAAVSLANALVVQPQGEADTGRCVGCSSPTRTALSWRCASLQHCDAAC